MGSTKPQPSFSTGWASPRIHSGVVLDMPALSMTTARAWSFREAPRTARTASRRPAWGRSAAPLLASGTRTTRRPSAGCSTCSRASSGTEVSTWMRTAVWPARCVWMLSCAIRATVPTFELSPTVHRPMATSAASDRTGSGLDSATRGASAIRGSLGQHGEQGEIVAEMPCDEEVAADVLAAGRAHAPDQLRVAKEVPDPEGRALYRLHRVAGDAGQDLVEDAPGQAAHHGFALHMAVATLIPKPVLSGL